MHKATFRPDPAFWWSAAGSWSGCAVWGSRWINTTTPVVWLQVVCFTVIHRLTSHCNCQKWADSNVFRSSWLFIFVHWQQHRPLLPKAGRASFKWVQVNRFLSLQSIVSASDCCSYKSHNLCATTERWLCYFVESAGQTMRLCGSKDKSWVWLICVHSSYLITYLFIYLFLYVLNFWNLLRLNACCSNRISRGGWNKMFTCLIWSHTLRSAKRLVQTTKAPNEHDLTNSRAYRPQNITQVSFYLLSVSVWSLVSPVICVRLCQGLAEGIQAYIKLNK